MAKDGLVSLEASWFEIYPAGWQMYNSPEGAPSPIHRTLNDTVVGGASVALGPNQMTDFRKNMGPTGAVP